LAFGPVSIVGFYYFYANAILTILYTHLFTIPKVYNFKFCKDREITILTFKSLAVSLRTTRFNFKKFYMVLALR
jgi:hypothetical protein